MRRLGWFIHPTRMACVRKYAPPPARNFVCPPRCYHIVPLLKHYAETKNFGYMLFLACLASGVAEAVNLYFCFTNVPKTYLKLFTYYLVK